MIREIKRKAANGIAVLLILLASIAMLVFFLIRGISGEDPVLIIGCIISLVVVVFLLFGLFVVNPNEASLVGNIPEISERLRHENQERLAKAGVEVIESRISHLAYAQRSPRRCCAGNRRPRSLRPAARLSRGPSVWSSTPSTSFPREGSWSSTRRGRRRWCPTCWSSCVASPRPNR